MDVGSLLFLIVASIGRAQATLFVLNGSTSDFLNGSLNGVHIDKRAECPSRKTPLGQGYKKMKIYKKARFSREAKTMITQDYLRYILES